MTARRRRSLARRSRVSAGLALTGLAVSACGGDRGAPPDALPAQSCASATAPYALEAPEPVWRYTLDDSIGFSVRVEDLDGDGEPEVLVPHGVEDPPSGGVVALSGETGEVVWTAPAEQQLYGSPVFLDVTGDGVKDVFAGGRNIEFLALDGASGQLVWRFEADGVVGSYNFYTAAFVPDQPGDGLAELLVANGGEDRALPPDP
ncbi:MAG TPA: PQQ-binding-like beta-propeller repeat protein, partial [Polyangiaceae bacterium]